MVGVLLQRNRDTLASAHTGQVRERQRETENERASE